MHSLPRLRPDVPPLRRGPDCAQLGLGNGLLLEGMTRGEVAVLDLLDGRHSMAQLYAAAAALGDPPERVDALLTLLDEQHLLTRPGSERIRQWHRERRRIWVTGHPVLSDAIRQSLRTHGRLEVGPGDPVESAATAGLIPDPASVPAPGDLIVVAASPVVPPRVAIRWLPTGVAHLAVVAAGPVVTIGPLVDPPLADAEPCLHCVELHRVDRDPARPGVLTQALGADALMTDPALVPAASSIATLVVAAYLDGQFLPAGVTMELSHPWPRLDHRRWTRHPRCVHDALPALPSRETMAG